MPLLRQIVILFACLATLPLAAQEAERSFVIPSDRAYASFAPQTPPTPKEQLQHVADSFGTQPPGIRPAPIQQASHANYQSAPTIVPASMGRVDATNIQSATVPPRPLAEAEWPESSPAFEDDEIVQKQPSLLDAPLVRSDSDAKGKMSKPLISGGVGPVVTMFASLFIVIATFLIFALLFKKVSPKGGKALSRDVFENLGRASLTQKFQLHLLRLGNRLILVSVTLDGVQPITEITDPDEVVQLLGLCQRMDPNSATQKFKKMFSALSTEQPEGGYFGVDVDTRPSSRAAKPTPRTKSSLVDLYSEPDESLTELLAKGLKGGRNG